VMCAWCCLRSMPMSNLSLYATLRVCACV
jgi:hypothetical protein